MTTTADLAPPAPDRVYRADRASLLWAIEREIVRFLKIWRFTIAGPVLSTLLFVVVFGSALGRQIQPVHGVGYGRFILPGLLVQAVLTVGFINGTTSLFEARKDRYINDVLASPLRWWEYNLALVTGAVVRGLLTAGGIVLLAVPLTGVSLRRPGVAAVAAVTTLVIAAQLGILVGAYARSLDHLYSVQSLAILPLTFLGGIFYSVDRLPQPWRVVSHLNPVFYLVQGARLGMVGSADVPAWPALVPGAVLAAGLTLWSVRVFRTATRLKP